MKLSRRKFVLLATGSAVSFVGGWMAWPDRFLHRVKRFFFRKLVGDRHQAMLRECQSGTLSGTQKTTLWELLEAMREKWGFVQVITKFELSDFLDFKTQSAPSYVCEYGNVVTLCKQHADAKTALNNLLGIPEISDVAQAQRFVLEEFSDLLQSRAGLTQFSILNTRGYLGGPRGYRLASRENL